MSRLLFQNWKRERKLSKIKKMNWLLMISKLIEMHLKHVSKRDLSLDRNDSDGSNFWPLWYQDRGYANRLVWQTIRSVDHYLSFRSITDDVIITSLWRHHHRLTELFESGKAFELYGGVAGFFDYGPIGCMLKNNIIGTDINPNFWLIEPWQGSYQNKIPGESISS